MSGYAITPEDRERLDDQHVVASVSGGKDSAALSLWLTEQGIDHDRVFADTGWEHPATIEYILGELTRAIGTVTVVRGKRQMAELVRHRKMFPTRLRRFCTQELKVRPIARYHRSLGCDTVSAVGIRADESASRAKMTRWEYWKDIDADTWRPLLQWSLDDVIAIHQRHGLKPNPLYLWGAERVGCWPCIFSRKREIALVAKLTPERVDEIRALESEVGDAAEQREAEDGKKRNRPTFFHPKGHNPEHGDFVGIDQVVEWSRTSHGGRQLLLLDTEPAGCVRWGMCEHQSEVEDG